MPPGGGSEPELTPDGADKTMTTGEKKPVCACNYFREVCDQCNKGWLTELKAGNTCPLGC